MFQKMAVLKGDLPSIEQQLNDGQFSGDETVWLAIEVEIQDFLSDLQQRIHTLTEELNVDVLQLRRARGNNNKSLDEKRQRP